MKVLFLDHDGVICLANNWGSRHKKMRQKEMIEYFHNHKTYPVHARFDNFDKKAIEVLNEILIRSNVDIVISSDWKLFASLEELREYYILQGIVKTPIGITPKIKEINVPNDFNWIYEWSLEQERCFEIKAYLKNNPHITNWVAVDDMMLGEQSFNFKDGWFLDNFVHTPRKTEGIKQTGIKDRILSFL